MEQKMIKIYDGGKGLGGTILHSEAKHGKKELLSPSHFVVFTLSRICTTTEILLPFFKKMKFLSPSQNPFLPVLSPTVRQQNCFICSPLFLNKRYWTVVCHFCAVFGDFRKEYAKKSRSNGEKSVILNFACESWLFLCQILFFSCSFRHSSLLFVLLLFLPCNYLLHTEQEEEKINEKCNQCSLQRRDRYIAKAFSSYQRRRIAKNGTSKPAA